MSAPSTIPLLACPDCRHTFVAEWVEPVLLEFVEGYSCPLCGSVVPREDVDEVGIIKWEKRIDHATAAAVWSFPPEEESADSTDAPEIGDAGDEVVVESKDVDLADELHRAKRRDGVRIEPCGPLMETCTPDVYRKNAFRILGLNADATTREVKRRVDDLKAAEEMGDAAAEHTGAYALDPPPSLDDIRVAALRLQEPEARLIDEFFWFWPLRWGTGKEDEGLTCVRNGDSSGAFNLWLRLEKNGSPRERAIAGHNLATIYHMVALDCEAAALECDFDQSQKEKIVSYWREGFRRWEALADDDEFWSLVTERIRTINDARLTTGFSRRMRASLPEALDRINGMLAVKFAERGKYPLVELHLAFMRETHAGLDNVAKTLADVTAPICSRVRHAIEGAMEKAKESPEDGAKEARGIIDGCQDPLRVVGAILSASDPDRVVLFDEVAEACHTCQVLYGRETEDWATCVGLLTEASVFASSPEVKEKLQKALETVSNNESFGRFFQPLLEELEAVSASERPRKEQFQTIKTVIVSKLARIKTQVGGGEVYDACANMIAGALRNISIEEHNAGGDTDLALEAVMLASTLAVDPKLKARLREDVATLKSLNSFVAFAEAAKDLVESNDPGRQKISAIEALVRSTLSKLGDAGMRDDVLKLGAQFLRAVAIKAANEHHDYQAASGAIDSALMFARMMGKPDPALSGTLNKDKETADRNALMARVSANRPSTGSGSGTGCLVALLIIGGIITISMIADQDGKDSSGSPNSGASPRAASTSSAGTMAPYRSAPPVFSEPQQPRPAHGWTQNFSYRRPEAPLTVNTAAGSDYFLKLEDASSGAAVMTVFVHGGLSAQVEVPLGTYRIKYASGETWYGPEHLFGPDTGCSMADRNFAFAATVTGVSGYTITLYKVRGGNLGTTKIAKDRF